MKLCWRNSFSGNTLKFKPLLSYLASFFFNLYRYRIDQISWISRQKFEEIWMTFLGILNLHNEDQVRPEEQASVIQVYCVRALELLVTENGLLYFKGYV